VLVDTDPEVRRQGESLLARDSELLAVESLNETSVVMLAAGTRLGACEIEASIGKDSMGQVWKARDTGLNRSNFNLSRASSPLYRESLE
jgi:hypothetical protein